MTMVGNVFYVRYNSTLLNSLLVLEFLEWQPDRVIKERHGPVVMACGLKTDLASSDSDRDARALGVTSIQNNLFYISLQGCGVGARIFFTDSAPLWDDRMPTADHLNDH